MISYSNVLLKIYSMLVFDLYEGATIWPVLFGHDGERVGQNLRNCEQQSQRWKMRCLEVCVAE